MKGVPSWDESDLENSYGSEDSGDNFEQYLTENIYVHDPNRVWDLNYVMWLHEILEYTKVSIWKSKCIVHKEYYVFILIEILKEISLKHVEKLRNIRKYSVKRIACAY